MHDRGWEQVARVKGDLDETVKDLDLKLNRVLAKQEYDYLKGYNIYVKKKEKELRQLIQEMQDKNNNSTFKDDRIRELEETIRTLRNDLIKTDKHKQELISRNKEFKSKQDILKSENDFLQK